MGKISITIFSPIIHNTLKLSSLFRLVSSTATRILYCQGPEMDITGYIDDLSGALSDTRELFEMQSGNET